MRKVIHSLICGAVVVALAGAVAAEDVIEIVDQTGSTVRIPQPVERLVSVYGAGTFYVYALGAADRLVMAWYLGVKGIGNASEAMFRLEPRLEDLLAFGDPNVEEIVAREAQLVLVDGSRHGAFAGQMAELGVPVIQYLVETPDALKAAVLLTGQVLGPEALERAIVLRNDYDRLFSTVMSDLESLAPDERVRVLFLGTDPLQVASGDMYQTYLIEAAGGISVSEDLTGYWNEVNLEQILLWDPDVILIPPYGPVQPVDVLENLDWAAIRAVRNGRVYRMPRVIAPMDTPVPESLLGVAWMASVLYPDLIRLDLATEVEHFYTFYYGYDLTEAELEHLTGR
jgi:iron complex transport system substrate-binding protein